MSAIKKAIKEEKDYVLSANDLLSGAVVFWSGNSWTPDFSRALYGDAENLAHIGTKEQAKNRIVDAYTIKLNESGQPVKLREQRRLAGVSVLSEPVNDYFVKAS